MTKKLISFCLVFVFALSFISCEGSSKQTVRYFDCFDTVTTISSSSYSENEFSQFANKIHNRMLYYNKLFDIYHEYGKINNLNIVNKFSGVKAVVVDKSIIELLSLCKEYYSLTQGKVNVCLGSVLSIWHEARKNGSYIPKIDDLKIANKHSEINNLVIDKQKSTVYLKEKNSKIDVGAIAKGFSAQKIIDYAKSIGFKDGIINIGGNVSAIGNNQGNGYVIGVENPYDTSSYIRKVKVSGKSVVTSGDYQRFFEVNGKRYCHIINPLTLFPANNNRSVTIISNNSALADALSTAVFITDYKKGLELINSIKNVEALIIDKNGKFHYSSGIANYLV